MFIMMTALGLRVYKGALVLFRPTPPLYCQVSNLVGQTGGLSSRDVYQPKERVKTPKEGSLSIFNSRFL